VTPGFFEAAGLPALAGRVPTDAEVASGARVVAVSDKVAREYWPDASAVGQTLNRSGEAFLVVGVVPDARYLALEMEPLGAVYYPDRASLVDLFIAYERGRAPELSTVLGVIAERHPTFRVRRAGTVRDTLANSIRERTFHAYLFGAFGLSAVVIVAVGVLGLAAVVASRRTREVGVRLALGARRRGLVALVVRQELAGVLWGLVAGALVAAWATRFLESYIYFKASLYDPVAWTSAALLLLGAAVVGSLIPAVRVSRTDPAQVLRTE
jgi:ABC-type antimicrobial peptide transport system permease subunit